MGQDQSVPDVDDFTPPQRLASRNLDGVAQYIKEGKARRIVVMTGAGISTSAGIPDFRSPDTGLYANLARLNLPYAEAVFDISYFRNNSLPFYTLAHELYPGKYRPTISHSFIKLLYDKGLLLKLFTQNIDCLEREAGVPGDKIVEAHGSFASQSCIECKSPYPDDDMHTAIHSKKVPHCKMEGCNGLVKPDIVFFGEALPSEFFLNSSLPNQADLCIIMGTSLSVHPFAALPQQCVTDCPRILINMEKVGGLGSRTDDVLLLGDCDTGVRKLAETCGWLEELEALWSNTAPEKGQPVNEEKKSRDEKFQEEMERITREVEETLKLNEERVANHRDEGVHGGERDSREQESSNHTTADQGAKQVSEASVQKPASEDLKTQSTSPTQPMSLDSKPASKSEPSKSDQDSGGGLRHVFVNLQEKSSL
jgi:NAD-dependent histone deacetylase SIR2